MEIQHFMISAVVTSDNHLGAYWARLRPDKLEARRRALQQNFARVVDYAIEHQADLFLHAGDLFDRPDPRNAERLFVAKQIQRLRGANIPVFIIAGNHDSPRSLGYDGGISPHEELAALGAVHLFRSTAIEEETLEIKGVKIRIRGASSDWSLPDGACPLDEYSFPPRVADVEIVLLHYGVEGWAQPFAREPQLSLLNLEKLGADVICVGHLHTPNERRLPGGGVLLNPGATEHIHFGEEKLECGFWSLEFDDGKTRAAYSALPTQPMRTLDLELSGDEEISDLLESIEAVSGEEQLLRVRLRGRVVRTRWHELDLEQLQQFGSEKNFHFQLEGENLVVFDELDELPVGYGVSFDVREELKRTAQLAEENFEDGIEKKLTRRAAQEIDVAYSALTKS
jgi:DNA repair exonuclease SbcCD nuclease subunit